MYKDNQARLPTYTHYLYFWSLIFTSQEKKNQQQALPTELIRCLRSDQMKS